MKTEILKIKGNAAVFPGQLDFGGDAFRFHRKICVNFPKVTGLFIHFSQTGCIMYGFYQVRNIPIHRAQRPERKEAGLWQATHSNAWRKK